MEMLTDLQFDYIWILIVIAVIVFNERLPRLCEDPFLSSYAYTTLLFSAYGLTCLANECLVAYLDIL